MEDWIKYGRACNNNSLKLKTVTTSCTSTGEADGETDQVIRQIEIDMKKPKKTRHTDNS